jgi:transcriptional regulator with XRE-family HTH domain
MNMVVEQRQTVVDDETHKRIARQEFISWVDHILERRQQDATHLALDSDLSPSTILRLLNNKNHTYLPSMTTLRKIANGSGYPIPQKLLQAYEVQVTEPDAAPRPRPTANVRGGPAAQRTVEVGAPRKVAVRHVSTLPKSLAPIVPSEQRVEVLPMLKDDTTAFAFKMPDDSLAPVVRGGAMVFASKSRDPAIDDIVLIVDENGRAKVRAITGVNEDGYIVSPVMRQDQTETVAFDAIKDWGIIENFNRR